MRRQIRIDLDPIRGHIHLQVQGDCQIYRPVDFENAVSVREGWSWVKEQVQRVMRGERLSDLE